MGSYTPQQMQGGAVVGGSGIYGSGYSPSQNLPPPYITPPQSTYPSQYGGLQQQHLALPSHPAQMGHGAASAPPPPQYGQHLPPHLQQQQQQQQQQSQLQPQPSMHQQAALRAARQRANTMEQQQAGIPSTMQRVASHLDPNAPIRLQPSPAYYPPPQDGGESGGIPGSARKGPRGSRLRGNANFIRNLEERTMEEGYAGAGGY